MIRLFSNFIISAFLFLVFSQCAQVTPLTGGKRDVTPPKLVEATPSNKSKFFQTQDIKLKFDEYISLKDPANQIVICPRLKINPEYEVHGKTILIKLLNQFLDPGITYRIDFGNSIVDMNEGNVLEHFDYTFSTGPFIDSLKIKGNVALAFNNKNVANALVGLYSNFDLVDSLVYKVKPTYTAKTNNDGEFTFYNLPMTKFSVYAFEDKNKNLLYDGESEQIAQLGPLLDLLTDTSIKMKMFKEDPNKLFIKRTLMQKYGFGQIIFNKPAAMSLKTAIKGQAPFFYEIEPGKLKDTVSFFYKSIKDTLSLVMQDRATLKIDTLRLLIPKTQNTKKNFIEIELNQTFGKLNYRQAPCLLFNNWMDTSRLEMKGISLNSTVDSVIQEIPVNGKWKSINQFELNSKLIEGNAYDLKINPKTFFNSEGGTNDSLSFKFKTQSKTDFGKLTLRLNPRRKQNYIVQLLNEKEELIKEKIVEYSMFSSGLANLVFTELVPGTYTLKFIFDNNQNNKWDKGSLLNVRLPEEIIISEKKIKIIADWESEEEILIADPN